MNAGDVALVRFPFSEATGAKRRPVLVLATAPEGLNEDHVVVLVEITGSAVRLANPREGDYVIPNWEELSLLRPSVIRCRRLFATEQDSIVKKIGEADEITFEIVVREVRKLLAFA